MDKRSAIRLVQDTFEYPFDKSKFAYLLSNVLDHIVDAPFIYRGSYIPDAYKPYIRTLERIGKYEDGEGNKIDLLIVRLKKETSLERARTMQRNFLAWYLNGSRGGVLKDAALAAFVSPDTEDWRFSLVKMDYRLDASGGKVKVKKELTPARRFSFLVGQNEDSHTAQSCLLPILKKEVQNPTLKELEDVFSIERVTREFFERYRDLFLRVKKELDEIVKKDAKIGNDFAKKCVTTADFAKKLLGQIVFLYFLQKKGWLGVGKDKKGDFKDWGTGPKDFLRQLFEKRIILYDNFFDDLLEPLFYEALATERESDYYARFKCKIPFLNGGLFEPINDYDWVHTDILLPDEIFSNDHKTKEGDVGTGILDVFDRYNFTVKEDEPLEKEVAVDPEMLGKVFENLLPENLRKGQGAYYTPREIVHYMCQESLINYLDTAVNTGEISLTQKKPIQEKLFAMPEPDQLALKTIGYKTVIPRKDIEDFIRKGEFAIEHDTARQNGTKSYKYQVPESIRNNAQLLDEKLKIIKICDPAIGSGAFPVGMMHEIVSARNVLETYLKTGKGFYEFKRHCIQESLYGVDIDPGAIEIAKLRLWLSLVVDEEDYNDIKPLPNLDYKIMQGNSLIEDFHGTSLNPERKDYLLLKGNEDLDTLIEDLHNKQQALFNATHRREKEQLKEKVEDAIVEIFHHDLKRREMSHSRELKRIEEAASQIPKEETRKKFYESEKAKLDKRYRFDFEAVENELREMTRGNRSRNFFPWKLYFADVFRKNSGFDVVIANPPYVRHEKMKLLKPLLAKEFRKFYCGTADIYTYFYKRGLALLKSEGCLCFIAPNKFMRAAYGKNTRRLLTHKGTPRFIIDFCDLPIFDATTYPAILLIKKNEPDADEKTLVTTFCRAEQLERIEETIANLGFSMPVAGLKSEGWCLEKPQVLALMEKIRKAGRPLGEYINGRFYRGILTGLNKAFVIDAATRERLIAEDPGSEELIKPWLRGKDIKRWRMNWAGLYVIFTRRGVDIDKYPAIKRHLNQFRKDLEPKNSGNQKHGRKPGSYKWYEIQDNIAYYSDFEKPKIVYPDISQFPKFTWDESKSYLGNTAYIMPSDEIWLVGLLNSKLMNWFYSHISPAIRGGFFRFIAQYMEQIPVVSASEIQKAPIVERVRAILKNPDGPDMPNLEAEINTLIFDLYDLTAEEIAIVEESIGRR